jgi:transcriptional regulator with PAS, ATPase and Fis domain
MAANCGARMNDDLWWSKLFGHKKGSFTGAISDKPGLFELAHEGTLFLDEVAELSPSLQASLLRALTDGIISRLGEDERLRRVDVRLISATNRNIEQMVESGDFREDLYFRLNVIKLDVPPLRERGDDIRLLVEHFLSKISAKLGLQKPRLSPDSYSLIYAYPWPGNVRELENALEQALVLADPGGPIGPERFPKLLDKGAKSVRRFEGRDLKEKIEAAERTILSEELDLSGWNISQCARRLGCTRQHLHNRIRKLRLKRPRRS